MSADEQQYWFTVLEEQQRWHEERWAQLVRQRRYPAHYPMRNVPITPVSPLRSLKQKRTLPPEER